MQGLLVPEASGHRHRLASEVSLRARSLAENASAVPSRAINAARSTTVVGSDGREGALEQPDQGRLVVGAIPADLVPAEAERRARLQIREGERLGQLGGLEMDLPRPLEVAHLPEVLTEDEQDLAAARRVRCSGGRERFERCLAVRHRAFVRELARRALGGAEAILNGLRRARIGTQEVMRQLRQVQLEVGGVEALERGADGAVQTPTVLGSEILVERLAEEIMHEREPAAAAPDDVHLARLVERPQRALDRRAAAHARRS